MRKNIKKYILLISILSVLILGGLAVLSYHAYDEATSLVKNQFNEQQSLLARQIATGIEENIKLAVRELELISRRPAIKKMDVKHARGALDQTFHYVKTLHVNDIALIDSKGIVRLPLKAPHLLGKDFSYREYFKSARLLKTAAPTYEFITFKGVDVGQKGIIIAMPVFPSNGEFGGVVLFTIKINKLIKSFGPSQTTDYKCWVIDNDNRILYHPRYEPGTIITKFPNLDISFKTFLNSIKTGREYKAEHISPEGNKVIAAAHPIHIAEQKWSIVIATPEETISGLLSSLNRDYIFDTSTAVLVIVSTFLIIIYLMIQSNLELQHEIAERKLTEEELQKIRRELEQRVDERTSEIKSANEKLLLEIAERERRQDELL